MTSFQPSNKRPFVINILHNSNDFEALGDQGRFGSPQNTPNPQEWPPFLRKVCISCQNGRRALVKSTFRTKMAAALS